MTQTYLFTGGKVLDAVDGKLLDGLAVLVGGGNILEVAPSIAAPSDAQEIELGGRTLMPGMIDCHMHVVAEIS